MNINNNAKLYRYNSIKIDPAIGHIPIVYERTLTSNK